MTSQSTTRSTLAAVQSASPRKLLRWLLLLGAPLALAAVIWDHPVYMEDAFASLRANAHGWYVRHLLLLPALAMLGGVPYLLLSEYDGWLATVGRFAVWVYVVTQTAAEVMAGIVVGMVLGDTEGLSAAQLEGVEAVFTPLFVDASVQDVFALLAVIGMLVAIIATVLVYRRARAPTLPTVLLFAAPMVVITHDFGMLSATFSVVLFVAVAWLEFGWRERRPLPERRRE